MICYNKTLAVRINIDPFSREERIIKEFSSIPIFSIKHSNVLKYLGLPIPDGENQLSAKASSNIHELLSRHFKTLDSSAVVDTDSYRKVITLQTLDDEFTFDILLVSDKVSHTISIYLKENESPKISEKILLALKNLI